MTGNPKDKAHVITPLNQLRVGEGGWISTIHGPEDFRCRLMEMGVLEEDFVQMVHEAPFGGDPVAIRVRGSLLALRRQEAQHISVRRVPRL